MDGRTVRAVDGGAAAAVVARVGRSMGGWSQWKCVVLLLEESSKSGVIGHAYHYSKAYDSQWHTSAALCLILTKNRVGT